MSYQQDKMNDDALRKAREVMRIRSKIEELIADVQELAESFTDGEPHQVYAQSYLMQASNTLRQYHIELMEIHDRRFPYPYEEDVWFGRKPAYRDYTYNYGRGYDVYCTQHGTVYVNPETDEVAIGRINRDYKVGIFICGEHLQITDIRHSGSSDLWEYNSSEPDGYRHDNGIHPLEKDRICRYLDSTRFPDNPIMDRFMRRAGELYEIHKRSNKGAGDE